MTGPSGVGGYGLRAGCGRGRGGERCVVRGATLCVRTQVCQLCDPSHYYLEEQRHQGGVTLTKVLARPR